MNLPIVGFAPDADPTIPGVLTNCSAAVPSLKGMKGAPSPASSGLPALAATCTGAATLAKLDESTRLFAGTSTKLYEGAVSSWSDVSKSTSYGSSSVARWRFAQFGDVSLATNINDTLQFSSTGAFADVSGAPNAAIVETVGQFVFLFYTSDATFGVSPNRWWCAGIGNYTSWTPAISTQAATGLLTSAPGQITAGRRFGDAIVVYKRRAMYLGVYVGAPIIWQFTQIPGEVGAMSHEAVVNIGTPENPKHIFMGADDFYIYDGAKPTPIGTNRVKSEVFGAILQNRSYLCTATHDKINNRVYFYYPAADSNMPDKCVVYNYRADRWGQDDRQIQQAVQFNTPGVTYDNLGNYYNTYDDLPTNIYDLAFLSSALEVPAVFDTANVLKTLTGTTTNSSITTGDYGNDEQVVTVTRLRPRFITAPTSATLVNYYRMTLGDALTTDTSTALLNGRFDFLRDARWHRARIDMVGDWELAVMDASGEASGLE